MAYKVRTYDGEDTFFYSEHDAEEYAEKERKRVHQKYCIDKEVPGPGECLCTRPDFQRLSRERTCAAHHYAKTVKEHTVDDCDKAWEVGVDEIDIH
jgi:hypothetical protein